MEIDQLTKDNPKGKNKSSDTSVSKFSQHPGEAETGGFFMSGDY